MADTAPVQLPHNHVGPPALRRQRRRTPARYAEIAPVTVGATYQPVRIPNPRVGPVALRRTWRQSPSHLVYTRTLPVLGDVRFWFTGAASDGAAQSSQAACLGNYRSSTEAETVGVVYQSGIDGLTVNMASWNNMVGPLGILKADPASGAISYVLSGGTTGVPVTIADGQTVTVRDTDNPAASLRVTRNQATNPSGSAVLHFHDQFNNVFAMSDAVEAQQAAGGSRYRALMVVANVDAANIRFWLATLGTQAVSSATQLSGAGAGTIQGATDCFIDWPQKGWAEIRDNLGTLKECVYYSSRTDTVLTVPALGRGRLGTVATAGAATDTIDAIGPYRIAWENANPPTGGPVQTIASESTAPTGVSWSAGVTALTGVGPSGTLLNGEQGGLWLHRELPAGVSGFSKHQCRINYSFTIAGVPYTGTLAGLFRIADDDAEKYELHVGVGSMPDLSTAPNETFTSLPYTTTLTLAPSTVNYLVVNRRNKYNLVTESRSATIIEIDSGGLEAQPAPTAPDGIAWRAGTGGTFVLNAVYNMTVDLYPANKFAIYVRTNGTDPDPSIDTPVLVDATDSGTGIAYLPMYTTAAFATGTEGRVIVQMKRTSDSRFSDNDDVHSATASTAIALTTPIGRAFFEHVAETNT